MRLGAYPAKLLPGSIVQQAYGEEVVYERHRHRYEVNNQLPRQLEEAGLVCSGTSPDDRLVEFIELAATTRSSSATQAHPEFKSRPDRPHPLFAAFVRGGARPGRGPRAAAPAPDRRSPSRWRSATRAGPTAGDAASGSSSATTLCDAGFLSSSSGARVRRTRRRASSTVTSCAIPGAVVVVPVTTTATRCSCASAAPRRPRAARGPGRQARRRRRAARGDRRARARGGDRVPARAGSVKLGEFYNSPGLLRRVHAPVPRARPRGARARAR